MKKGPSSFFAAKSEKIRADAFVSWKATIGVSPTGGDTNCAGAAVGSFTPGWCLFAALALHVGINLILQFPIFQYVMMTSLILFLNIEKPIGFRRLIAGFR